MSEFDYGPDFFFTPIVVTSANNTIVIEELDSGGATLQSDDISISEGRYWNHLTPSSTSPDNQDGLLRAIQEALNSGTNALSGFYSISENTPASSDLPYSGISIDVDGVADVNIRDDSSSSTMDVRWLGFAPDTVPSSTDGILDSPYSLQGQFQSSNIIGGIASKKWREPMKAVAASSDDASHARGQVLAQFDVRTFVYEGIQGAVVRKGRAHDQGSAQNIALPWYGAGNVPFDSFSEYNTEPYGDIHNHFEHLFDVMTSPGEGNMFAQVVVLYDGADQSDSMQWDEHEVERCRLRITGDQGGELSQYVSPQRMKGEYYKLEFTLQVIDDWGYRQ